jgi:1-acyl-sn-glycerol-3-phosphate acyltransferase
MKVLITLRSLLATLIFPFTVLILGPIGIVGHSVFHNRKFDNWILSTWGRICCRLAGVKVVVEGEENIPLGGCLFLFNHTSFFDVFAMIGYIEDLRFGAKAELFKIPVFSHTMRAMGTLPIARNNREEVIKIYEEAKARFANGEKFALSPEGGRFYTGGPLAPFKAGPFLFAMSAGAPVVPLVIIGAYEALPKGGFLFNSSHWKHTITIKILEPVKTADFTADQRRELQQLVYERMNRVWLASRNPIN